MGPLKVGCGPPVSILSMSDMLYLMAVVATIHNFSQTVGVGRLSQHNFLTLYMQQKAAITVLSARITKSMLF